MAGHSRYQGVAARREKMRILRCRGRKQEGIDLAGSTVESQLWLWCVRASPSGSRNVRRDLRSEDRSRRRTYHVLVLYDRNEGILKA